MRANLSLKTLYRSPVRTVLTFILLVAVTFALFSQLMEYSVAKREMDKMVDTYQGVGVVENGVFVSALNSVPAYMYSDPRVPQGLIPDEIYSAYRKLGYEHFPAEAMNAMLDLPNITYADTRYMTAGVTELRRIDEGLGYYDYTNICVMEGTVSNYNDRMGSLIVTDVKLIGGEAISNTKYEEYGIYVAPEPNIMLEQSATPVCYRKVNNRAVTTATENSLYTLEFIQSLEIGQRYVFILRYEDDFIIKPDIGTYYLTDPFIYGKYDAVYPLAGEPENYIETEKFAPLREYIEIVETDQYTLDVVYTTNMESIRYFAEKKIGISEGRPLTNKDTKKREDVCVINNYLAYKYDLAVGDKITVNLGNKLFSQNHGVGAVAAVSERASTEFTTVELEIVGIFMDTRNKYSVAEYNEAVWSYGANTIFVPQHLLNVSDEELENHTFHSGEVSFVVEDAWDIPQFIEQSVPLVEEMGYSMKFDDGGFMDIYEALVETERIAYIKISVLLFAIVVVTWFIAMLFVVGRRQDYAIMRLLGTAKPDAAKTLLLPLTVIAAAAVIVGTVSAYISTVQNIADSQYLSVVTGVEIDLSISPWVVIGCVAGELILTLLLALLLISIIGRKSPLELMQSANRQRREKRRRKKEQTVDSGAVVVLGEWKSIERPHTDRKSRSAAFVMRYIFRHIRRTGGKALLFVFVAVLLINVLGQLIIMRESYIEIFESTQVTADFTGYLSLKYVDELIKSGYVKDVYYYTNRNVSINRSRAGTTVTFCCDLELYAKSKGVENLNITWLEGYDASSMHGLSNVIVIGEDRMLKYGYELGETLEISRENEYQAVTKEIVNKFRVSDKKYATYTNKALAEIKRGEIMEIYSKNMDEFTIIGVIHGVFVEELFAPGSPKASADFGSLIIPPYVTAVVADNYKAEEFREFAEEIAYINRHSDVVFIMNTAKIENVKNNIDLLKTLYPIMVAAVLIIGAFLCGLIIVQTSKDIAIMRVLGTSKAKTRTILVLEQMILCVVGVIISGAVLYIRGVFMQMLWVFGAYTLVILVSAIVASIAASRKNVLELLQTKE